MNVVFSRRDAEWFSPPHAPERRYLIAPLTFRERQAFRADLARDGGIYPPQAQMLEALRLAITEAAPGNAEELAAAIARAEAEPDDPEAQAPLAMIEAACAAIPSYAGLLAARQRYIGMLPWVVRRQHLWDQIGDLSNGGFLAHRNPKESEDEPEILRPTHAGTSRKACT
ncbi:MAG: hypothetical protein INF97_08685, partial [Roseomonas sp.]|nr:hypothetical protein [Roseomonas sp.]